MRFTPRSIMTGLGIAALVLAGCGDGETTDTPDATIEDSNDENATERAPSGGAEDPDDQSGSEDEPQDEQPVEDPADEAPAAAFDPNDAVPMIELEVRDELIFPDGPMPESLVVPAGATVATYDSQMDDGDERYHNATGALLVDDHDVAPDEVMAFFPQHLEGEGWELVEERENGMQVWHRQHPDVEVLTQEFRVETVQRDGPATIRWWFTNNG